MAIPRIQELYNPILDFLYKNGPSVLSTIRDAMAKSFYVNEEEAFSRDDNKPTLFMGRVNNACFNMYYAGLVTRVSRGLYDISPKGKYVVEHDNVVDSDFLYLFPSYQEYKMRQFEIGVGASAPEEEDWPLPIPNPDLDDDILDRLQKTNPEYEQIPFITIDDLASLQGCDTRFANMIESGAFLYEDGTIKAVPQEVRMHDMSYQEFKATTLSHSSDTGDILFYKNVNYPGQQIKTAPPKSISGYRRDPKGPDKWENPIPWVSSSGAALYPIVQKFLDFARLNPDPYKCFSHLIKDVYKIKEQELADRSGVDKKKIQRMMNGPASFKVHEMLAIFWVIQAPAKIIEKMFELSGVSPNSTSNEKYILICTLTVHSTYKEVNDACVKAGLNPIFPVSYENKDTES